MWTGIPTTTIRLLCRDFAWPSVITKPREAVKRSDTPPTLPSRRRSIVRSAMIALLLAASALFDLQGYLGSTTGDLPQPQLAAVSAPAPAVHTTPIEQITVGHRVLGQIFIGFVDRHGRLTGELVNARKVKGHEELAYMYEGLLSKLKSGQAFGVTVGKMSDGTIVAYGSGTFPPPGGIKMAEYFRELVKRLIE